MNKYNNTILIFTIILLDIIVLICSCINSYRRVELDGIVQGTYYHIVYLSKDGYNYRHEIDSVLHDIDMSLSYYEPKSLLTRFNNGDTTVVLDRYFIDNLIISDEVYRNSYGAFDITGTPLFDYWGFGNNDLDSAILIERYKEVQNTDTINILLQKVGFDKVTYNITDKKITNKVEGLKLCFNAVAQGYSVGIVGELLESYNIKDYCIDIGGEVYAKGMKSNGELWNVGIEKPSESSNGIRSINDILKIKDKAVVTSGNYRKYYELNGKKYSHTIDPRTGYPVNNNILSVTIIHDRPAYADAWATAFMVLGLDTAQNIIRQHPEMKAYIIYTDSLGIYQVWRNDL